VPPIPGLFSSKFPVPLLILALACAASVQAQNSATPLISQATIAQPIITQAIDEAKLVTLHGNVHPLAQARYDWGTVPYSLAANRILLLLNRPQAQQTALQQFMKDVHTRGSASYHQWLTPQQFGERFGPADSDVQTAVGWLQSHGFKVARVSKSKGLIEFSGTAGQVRQALHTQIHKYNIHGETHYANAGEISIPEALAPLVRGISPLNNFHAQPQLQVLGRASYSSTTKKTTPQFTLPNDNSNFYAVAPEDLATQYDLAPLYQAGVNGTGQTIGIINESNIDISLVSAYQQLFGLPGGPPQVVIDGDDPGLNGADIEAYLDVEVSGAVAPNANVNLYISNGSDFQDPVALSALRAIEDNQASVLSVSFGGCEQFEGNSGNQLWSDLWEEAAAQGQTVFVSSGDNGSAGCDIDGQFPASSGLTVNGLASTPWNVAVGGTDFYYSDYASGAPSAATLWSQTNDSNLGSLKAPLPEQPWNDYFGLDAVDLYPGNLGDVAAGGGASSCAVQSSSNACTSGYPKPIWQTGPGVPTDDVRDLPDVSLFASNGANMSAYAICPFQGACAPGADNSTEIYLVGGTSASSPAMAGIMALIDQKYGRQGQANFTIYPLSQQKPSAFHDVTLGNNNVNCNQGSPDCSLDSNGDGFYTLQKYSATTGYDLASGLGSLDANVLVSNWNSVTFLPTSTALHLSAASIVHGTPLTVSTTVAATSGSGVPTGGVAILTTSPLPDSQSQTSITLSGGTGSQSVDFFPGGSYQVTAQYGGDGVYGGSTSTPVSLKVTPENANINFQVINGQTHTPITTGGALSYTVPLSLTIEPIGVSAPSGMTNGNATGTATFNVDSISATVPMNAEGVASWTPPTLAIGNHTASATYSGDASFNASSSTTPVTFSITKGYPSLQSYASGLYTPTIDSANVNVGGSLTIVSVVTPYIGFVPAAGFAAPTGTVTVCLGGQTVCNDPVYSQTVPLVSPSGNNATESSATVTFTNLAAGQYLLTSLYNGDANWLTQGSLNLDAINVAPIPTLAASTTTLNISPTTISGTQLTTFTITVTGSGGVAPTGGVYCFSNGILIVNDALTPAPTGATSSATFQIGQGWFWNNGANPMTAVYYGDGNYQPSSSTTVTVNVTQVSTADFTLATQQPQINVQSGGSGTVGVNLASLNSFNGVVTLACTPSSANITCSVNPASPTLNGTTTATVTINSTAALPATQLPATQTPAASLPSRSGLAGWLGAGGSLICAFVLLGGLSDDNRKRSRLRALGLFAALALFVSCGGSSTTPPPPPPPPPAATYNVVVSGTANGIVHNAKVLVVVQ
jgi:subtilase family serine protease